jgi:hypothetical protein
MDLLQNSPAGSYVDAGYATVNNVARDQLNTIVNTTINRKFIILPSVYLASNPSRL